MDWRSAIFLLVFSLAWSAIGSGADAYHLAFHPRDLLPLLPGSIALPVLKSFHGAVDLLPQFVGAVSSGMSRLYGTGLAFIRMKLTWSTLSQKRQVTRAGASFTSRQVAHTAGPAWISTYLLRHTV